METVKGPNFHHLTQYILMPSLEGSNEQWNKKISWNMVQSLDCCRLMSQQTLYSKIQQSFGVLCIHFCEPASGGETFRSSATTQRIFFATCASKEEMIQRRNQSDSHHQLLPYRHRLEIDLWVYNCMCLCVLLHSPPCIHTLCPIKCHQNG